MELGYNITILDFQDGLNQNFSTSNRILQCIMMLELDPQIRS